MTLQATDPWLYSNKTKTLRRLQPWTTELLHESPGWKWEAVGFVGTLDSSDRSTKKRASDLLLGYCWKIKIKYKYRCAESLVWRGQRITHCWYLPQYWHIMKKLHICSKTFYFKWSLASNLLYSYCEQVQVKNIEWDIETHIKLQHQACCAYTCLRMAKLFPHMVPPNGGFCAKG